jgi:transcriptional regulator of arginine metabolism
MSAKALRQQALRELLTHETLGSQAAVREALAARGITAHPATVGRDLEELGARRARDESGRLAYRLETDRTPDAPRGGIDDALRAFVTSIEASGNLLVLRTPPACASPVASALDSARDGSIIGTLAGDDTVIAIVGEGFDPDAVLTSLRARITTTTPGTLNPSHRSTS